MVCCRETEDELGSLISGKQKVAQLGNFLFSRNLELRGIGIDPRTMYAVTLRDAQGEAGASSWRPNADTRTPLSRGHGIISLLQISGAITPIAQTSRTTLVFMSFARPVTHEVCHREFCAYRALTPSLRDRAYAWLPCGSSSAPSVRRRGSRDPSHSRGSRLPRGSARRSMGRR